MTQDKLTDIYDKCMDAPVPGVPKDMPWNAASFESSDCLWNIETDAMWVRTGVSGVWVEIPQIEADEAERRPTRSKRNRGR